MKRRLSFAGLIAVLLIMLCLPSAASQVVNTDKAEILKTMGLLKGTSQGFELDQPFTRAQGAVVIIRLLGLETLAFKYSGQPNFKDVKENYWAKKHIEYAFQNGIIRGTDANIFSPNRNISGAEFITLILRGLGYKDVVPNTAASYAVQTGMLTKMEAYQLTAKKVFLRDDMVFVMYRALTIKFKNENKTLIQKLVETKVISKETALASKLYNPQPSGTQDPMDRIEEAIKDALKKR